MQPNNVVLTYALDGQLKACVHIEHTGAQCYLGMLTIEPAEQGRGLGKQLLGANNNLPVNNTPPVGEQPDAMVPDSTTNVAAVPEADMTSDAVDNPAEVSETSVPTVLPTPEPTPLVQIASHELAVTACEDVNEQHNCRVDFSCVWADETCQPVDCSVLPATGNCNSYRACDWNEDDEACDPVEQLETGSACDDPVECLSGFCYSMPWNAPPECHDECLLSVNITGDDDSGFCLGFDENCCGKINSCGPSGNYCRDW